MGRSSFPPHWRISGRGSGAASYGRISCGSVLVNPRTIHQLIRVPHYPWIGIGVFSLQSGNNVSVELGESKRRSLFVPVGKVPEGRTELLRTSLFAFQAFPDPAHKGFYVANGSGRCFGDFLVQDIPVGPKPMGWK